MADGATNEIARFGTYNSGWVQQRTCDFTAPSASVYRVAIQGTLDSDSLYEAHIDAITLRQVLDTFDATPPFSETARISVAEGACLRTDFSGTNKVSKLRLGGRSVYGVVSSETHPVYLSGTGAFLVSEPGMSLSIR